MTQQSRPQVKNHSDNTSSARKLSDITPGTHESETSSRVSKIPKTRHSQVGCTSKSSVSTVRASMEFHHDLLFFPSDFCPDSLKACFPSSQKSNKTLTSTSCNALHEDGWSQCLFSGFLDTLEVVRLTSGLSKDFRRLSQERVMRLDLSRLKHLTVSDIQQIVKSYPNLTDLNFDFCTQFDTQHLQALIPLAKSLQRLSLNGCIISTSAICAFLEDMAQERQKRLVSKRQHQTLPTTALTYLNLSATDQLGSIRLGDSALKAIATFCPRLETLHLEWCRGISDRGLKYLAYPPQTLSSGQYLKELNLSLTNLTDDCLPHLEYMLSTSQPNLTKLDLSATRISVLSFCQTFTTKSNDMTSLTDTSSATVKPIQLQHLSLRFLSEVSGFAFEKLLRSQKFVNLVHIDLTYCESILDKTTVEEILKEIPQSLHPKTLMY